MNENKDINDIKDLTIGISFMYPLLPTGYVKPVKKVVYDRQRAIKNINECSYSKYAVVWIGNNRDNKYIFHIFSNKTCLLMDHPNNRDSHILNEQLKAYGRLN